MSNFSPLIAAAVTLVLIFILLRSSAAHKIQDIPNERSLHMSPTPRVGGMALIIGVMCAWSTLANVLPWWIVWPVALLFAVSILDDMRGLSVRNRLLAHLLAAGLFVHGIGYFGQPVLPWVMLLVVVWVTNLYNFMDGADGLAGGMTLLGFTVYAVAAMQAQYVPFALLNFSIAAAAGSFLLLNFYPAKIFMGDAGSIPLGFLAAAMGLWGYESGIWPAWFPLLVFSSFVVDATVTLIKRIFRREKIWQAHREHYYQYLVQIGWGHRKTALAEYILMFSSGVSALIAVQLPALRGVILLGWCLIYIIVMLRIEWLWKNRKYEKLDAN